MTAATRLRAGWLRAVAVAQVVVATWLVAGIELVRAFGLVGGAIAVWGGSSVLVLAIAAFDRPAGRSEVIDVRAPPEPAPAHPQPATA